MGGQPNVAGEIDIPGILRACCLETVVEARTVDEINAAMNEISGMSRAALVLHTHQGSRGDLGRPTVTPADNKLAMMRRIGSAQ